MPSELHEFNLFDLTNVPFGQKKKTKTKKHLLHILIALFKNSAILQHAENDV